MRAKAIFASGVLTATFLVVVYGCGDDDPVVRTSLKGEACQVTNDCASGLACVPVPGGAGGICTVGTFRISQTARECALIDCTSAADCCDNPPTTCPNLKIQCDADSGSSSTFACNEFERLCKCDTAKVDCENSKCVQKCTGDLQCQSTGSGRKCAGGKCVACASDSDCSSGQQCLNAKCQAPCQTDGDCAGFDRCLAGKCVASGCQTDRECVAATRNVEATCGTDGNCIVPCQTDLECGNPKAYSFFSCIQNQCIYTGCQSDKDCRLLFSGPSDASTIGPKQHVVCREKTTPGAVTKPAF
jgi:Cys-rich repeat protein